MQKTSENKEFRFENMFIYDNATKILNIIVINNKTEQRKQ